MTGVKGHKVNPHPDFHTNGRIKNWATLRECIQLDQWEDVLRRVDDKQFVRLASNHSNEEDD